MVSGTTGTTWAGYGGSNARAAYGNTGSATSYAGAGSAGGNTGYVGVPVTYALRVSHSACGNSVVLEKVPGEIYPPVLSPSSVVLGIIVFLVIAPTANLLVPAMMTGAAILQLLVPTLLRLNPTSSRFPPIALLLPIRGLKFPLLCPMALTLTRTSSLVLVPAPTETVRPALNMDLTMLLVGVHSLFPLGIMVTLLFRTPREKILLPILLRVTVPFRRGSSTAELVVVVLVVALGVGVVALLLVGALLPHRKKDSVKEVIIETIRLIVVYRTPPLPLGLMNTVTLVRLGFTVMNVPIPTRLMNRLLTKSEVIMDTTIPPRRRAILHRVGLATLNRLETLVETVAVCRPLLPAPRVMLR